MLKFPFNQSTKTPERERERVRVRETERDRNLWISTNENSVPLRLNLGCLFKINVRTVKRIEKVYTNEKIRMDNGKRLNNKRVKKTRKKIGHVKNLNFKYRVT